MWAIMTVRLFPPSESCRSEGNRLRSPSPEWQQRGGGGSSYLQQTGQLAVSVVDVLVAGFFAEGVDAVPQRQEGAVDVGPLFEALTPILSLTDKETSQRFR